MPNTVSKMRILALDVGSKVIGLAVWGVENQWSKPIDARRRKILKEDMVFFRKLISDLKIEGFLVGLPYSLSGNTTQSTENALFWVEQLKKEFELPVFTYDESLSTKEALELLKDRSKKERKEKKDSIAAGLFLEEFMRDRGDQIFEG